MPGIRKPIAVLAALALLPLAAVSTATAQAPAEPAAGAAVAPRELLVRFDPGTSGPERRRIAQEAGAEVIESFSVVPRLTLVELPPGLGVRRAERLFESRSGVSYAEPNAVRRLQAKLSDDPDFGALWGLDNSGQPFGGGPDNDIDAPEAWDLSTGDPAVTVGVIDSGLTLAHEDIAGNLWENTAEATGTPGLDDDSNGYVDDVNGWDFVEDDATPDDAHTHGTHVAGTIGAQGNNALGVTGVNWDVGLMGLKAGSADGLLYTSTIVAALEYADEMGADVVNGSYGGSSFSASERDAMALATDTLFVVAAGNAGADNDAAPSYPCNYDLDNVVCVAATNTSDDLASFSNFGKHSVDLGAPGTFTLSTEPAFEAPVFTDDFEDGTLAKWTVGGTGSPMWTNSAETPRIGTRALTDSAAGNYPDDADRWIRLASPIDLSGKDSCRLRFASSHDLAGGDTLRGEYNVGDPDADPWLSLALSPYSGTSAFQFRNIDLDLFGASGAAAVYVRFRLISDAGLNDDGAHIDDVKVECVDASASTYGLKQGTSMATPHVAGAAALLLAHHPAYSAGQLRDALLANVDPDGSLQCRVATGGRLNAFAALQNGATATPPVGCPTPVTQTFDDPPPLQEKKKAKKRKCKKPKGKKRGKKQKRKCKKKKKKKKKKS